jgi:hypothetical protein
MNAEYAGQWMLKAKSDCRGAIKRSPRAANVRLVCAKRSLTGMAALGTVLA